MTIRPPPDYVDSALCEWETVTFTAYQSFEQHDRGAVGISEPVDKVEMLYGEREFFALLR